jgi:hypothetical protein
MIRIDGRGAVYGEVWFEEEPLPDPGVDIVLYRQRHAPVPGARMTPFLSLLTDLTEERDAIANRFNETCRYQVRRADTKDGLTGDFITDPEGRLEEFCAFYDAFAQQKSLAPCDRQWLAAACKARELALASASRDGEALVWHAYVMSGKTAQLQYTGSCFRNHDKAYRALVGRANRWLHWKCLLWFKESGMSRYDWGGLFEDESVPERAGINEFKRTFGGRPERTFICTVPVTLRGRIYVPLREAWRRLNRV